VVVEGEFFADLLGFLKGVLEKTGVFVWCFGGEFVVNCVVECGGWQRYFGG
jgi:hypothetical protein